MLVVSSSQVVPPFPQEYSTLYLFKKQFLYQTYVKIKLQKDRVDTLARDGSISMTKINDYQLNLTYTIQPNNNVCFSNNLRSPRIPFLFFPLYKYLGNSSCHIIGEKAKEVKDDICNYFEGCLVYYRPPMPFLLTTTLQDNIPVDLVMTTMATSYSYLHFQEGNVPDSVFQVPSNCTSKIDENEELPSEEDIDWLIDWKKVGVC